METKKSHDTLKQLLQILMIDLAQRPGGRRSHPQGQRSRAAVATQVPAPLP